MYAYGVLIASDTLSNKIGVVNRDIYTEFDTPIRRRLVIPQIDNDGQPFWLNTLELWGEEGIGLNSGQGSNPEVLMSFSTDGARTFSGEVSRSFVQQGEYTNRCIWNNSINLVQREVCVKFEVSDPVKWTFAKVEAYFD